MLESAEDRDLAESFTTDADLRSTVLVELGNSTNKRGRQSHALKDKINPLVRDAGEGRGKVEEHHDGILDIWSGRGS